MPHTAVPVCLELPKLTPHLLCSYYFVNHLLAFLHVELMRVPLLTRMCLVANWQDRGDQAVMYNRQEISYLLLHHLFQLLQKQWRLSVLGTSCDCQAVTLRMWQRPCLISAEEQSCGACMCIQAMCITDGCRCTDHEGLSWAEEFPLRSCAGMPPVQQAHSEISGRTPQLMQVYVTDHSESILSYSKSAGSEQEGRQLISCAVQSRHATSACCSTTHMCTNPEAHTATSWEHCQTHP